MDGEWSFLEAQVEQVDLVGGGVTRWNAMNVGNLGTLLGNAAFALEQLAWVLEAVVGVLAQAHDPVVAQVMVAAGILLVTWLLRCREPSQRPADLF
jgi:hypothetical protein